MEKISSFDSLSFHGGMFPPIDSVPLRIVCANPLMGWCQVCAVPFSGGGGSFPSSPRSCHFSTVPSAFWPWQFTQFARYRNLPFSSIFVSYPRFCATAGFEKTIMLINNPSALCGAIANIQWRTGLFLILFNRILMKKDKPCNQYKVKRNLEKIRI